MRNLSIKGQERMNSGRQIKIHDCTLREGSQASGISFSLQDKLKITQLLDDMGFAYIEGGWPGANSKDTLYFQEIRKIPLKQIKVVGFSRTKNHGVKASHDTNLSNLIEMEVESGHVFGKGWEVHVRNVLNISLEENLDLVYDSVHYLKRYIPEVSFGFEHFFDAYKGNPEYSLKLINSVISAGVDWIDLADTNGGCFPHEIARIVSEVTSRFSIPFAVHCHDDTGCAVANTIMAVLNGVTIVEGTINGYAERCGMADLCTLIPDLQLKLGYACIPDGNMKYLTRLSREVAEIVQNRPSERRPYTGAHAFTHKAGVHVDAFLKAPGTYQHIDPALVGNRSNVIVSEVSGKSNIIYFLNQHNLRDSFTNEGVNALLSQIKEMELAGYDFDVARESLLIVIMKRLGIFSRHIEIKDYNIQIARDLTGVDTIVCGGLFDFHTAKGLLANQRVEFHLPGKGHFAQMGKRIIRELSIYFPELKNVSILDYQIRVISLYENEPNQVRVLLRIADLKDQWNIIGVGANFTTALRKAIIDAFEYRLNLPALEQHTGRISS